MCGPHEDSDLVFGLVRHFDWHSFSTPLHHKLSVALTFLLMSLCTDSTISYPHKEFLISPRKCGHPQPPFVSPPRAGLQYRVHRRV